MNFQTEHFEWVQRFCTWGKLFGSHLSIFYSIVYNYSWTFHLQNVQKRPSVRPEHEGLDIKAKGTTKGINKKKKN